MNVVHVARLLQTTVDPGEQLPGAIPGEVPRTLHLQALVIHDEIDGDGAARARRAAGGAAASTVSVSEATLLDVFGSEAPVPRVTDALVVSELPEFCATVPTSE